jgi:LuxR family maltose regulon positive regulatory protein
VIASSFQQDAHRALADSQTALQLLPEANRVWRGAAAVSLGHVYNTLGKPEPAAVAYSEAIRANRSAGNTQLVLRATIYLLSQRYVQGRLHETFELGQQVVRQAGALGPAGRLMGVGAHLYLAYVLYEWNRLGEALAEAQQVVELGKRWHNLGIIFSGLTILAGIQFARQEAAGVEAALSEADRLAQQELSALPDYAETVRAVRTLFSLGRSRLEGALEWASRIPIPVDPGFEGEFINLVLARVFIQSGQALKVIPLLEKIRGQDEANGRVTNWIEALLVEALALSAAGRFDAACERIVQALTLARPEGFVRVFLNEGRPVADLLSACQRRFPPGGELQEHASRLLFAFQHSGAERMPGLPSRKPGLVEPLTGRELEILGLIAAGYSNPEIAARLFLSLNTVKVHIKNLYGKLEVENRVQAVERGRELNLI